MSEALRTQARDILREKTTDKKVALINQILDSALESARLTGLLDLTPFIVACFVAIPNDEVGTAKIIRETKLLQVLPQLKIKELFQQLITKGRIKILVDPASPEVTVLFSLEELVDVGNSFHQKVQADSLVKRTVAESAKTIINFI